MKEEKPRRNGGTSLRWTARAIARVWSHSFSVFLCEARNDAARRGELETILQTGEQQKINGVFELSDLRTE